jgi:hypothetical protein
LGAAWSQQVVFCDLGHARCHLRIKRRRSAIKALTERGIANRAPAFPSVGLSPNDCGGGRIRVTPSRRRSVRSAQDFTTKPKFLRIVAITQNALGGVDIQGACQERPIIAAWLSRMRRHVAPIIEADRNRHL